MPVSIALKLGLAAAVGAAAAALSHNIQPALPPPFEMVSLVMSNGRQLDAGRDEITWALWKQCHDTGACENLPPAPPNDGRNYPATRINGQDVEQFLSWINAKTGDEWRLPTLTEWFSSYLRVLGVYKASPYRMELARRTQSGQDD